MGYDHDLFAAAVVLFITVFGTPPFSSAEDRDPWYNLLAKGNYQKFWQA